MRIVVTKAISRKEILRALRARWRWFGGIERYPLPVGPCSGMETDHFDRRTETAMYLAHHNDKLVGCFRVVYPQAGGDEPNAFIDAPYVIDDTAEGSPFGGQTVADVGRFCMLPAYRGQGVSDATLVVAAKDSLDRGVSVWHSGVYMGTNVENDAMILHQSMVSRGWVRTDIAVTLRSTAKPEGPEKPFFRSEVERRRAMLGKCNRLPPAIVADRRAGVDYIAKPYYEPDMGSYAHPMIVSVHKVLANCKSPS